MTRTVRMAALACALAAGALPEQARGAEVSWREDVRVPPGAVVEQDVLAIGGSADVAGEVRADVVVVRGDVTVTGRVDGDVVAFLGHVRLEPGAEIAGDVVAVGGTADVDARARVGGEVTVVARATDARPTWGDVARSPAGLIVRLAIVLAWTVLAVASAFAAPHAIVRAAQAVRTRPLRVLAVGLLLQACVLLVLVLCVALVVVFVGLPLLALLGLALVVLKALGFAATFHAVGSSLVERLRTRPVSGYASVLLGALVLGAADFVPWAGPLAWWLAAAVGMGAIVSTWSRAPAPEPR